MAAGDGTGAESRRLMRNPSRAADQSWPDMNHRFNWPPDPPKRKRPGRDTRTPSTQDLISNLNIQSALTAQRACEAAMRRADAIARRSAVLADIGMVDAALRLAAVAADIRTVVT